jgi:hypothetical protein
LAHSEMSQNGFCTKHMDIRLHFVWEIIITRLIKLKYIRTTANSADFFTKPTGQCTICRSLAAIGVKSLLSNDDHKDLSAPCLAAQSNPGCRIISADQIVTKRRSVRNDRVTPNGKSNVSHNNEKEAWQLTKALSCSLFTDDDNDEKCGKRKMTEKIRWMSNHTKKDCEWLSCEWGVKKKDRKRWLQPPLFLWLTAFL